MDFLRSDLIMEKLFTKIDIGLPKPLRLIHFSDTHLTRADNRDHERKIKLAVEPRCAREITLV